MQLTTEERIFVVRAQLRNISFNAIQREFRERFGCDPPHKSTKYCQWEPVNGNLSMGTCQWEPVNGNLGTCQWEPVNGNLSMGTCQWEPVNGNLSMGTCQWEPVKLEMHLIWDGCEPFVQR